MIFDNSLGRLGGPYGSYQEISIKRIVTRQGDSSYFLNQTRCRKKDITDIFLGTGAGNQGYAIIGQDAITRIIDAKPVDLKNYLEEAAGISKYKERKRETLSKLETTRQNLARVHDIILELTKQLERLQKQSEEATRYKQLKSEERSLKANITALKWQELQLKQEQKEASLKGLQQKSEEQQIQLNTLLIEDAPLNDLLQKQQKRVELSEQGCYQAKTDIAILEEKKILNNKEQKRLQQDLTEIEQLIFKKNEDIAKMNPPF